ncbi:response regulator transcription factor [uncultured Desulfobacter sp.]|uniref:response regulator transcription factor n=1 Tax=uncultured Desulfobacter sp. TaxID=240139 RepID=UPI0029F4D0E4|nr:response regulator transcription factor [uncultured Desulfobacter sp.]
MVSVHIYSKDLNLVQQCRDLFGGRKKTKHFSADKTLAEYDISSNDILIIDFDACDEKDLPKIVCSCLALVAIPQKDQALRLLQKGIRAYGNRYMHEENLKQAVTTLKAGQIWLPPAIISQVISALPAAKTEDEGEELLNILTSREAEVAKWLVNGLSNQEISEKMFVSVRTVKAHLTSIFKKTGCRNRLELATRMK